MINPTIYTHVAYQNDLLAITLNYCSAESGSDSFRFELNGGDQYPCLLSTLLGYKLPEYRYRYASYRPYIAGAEHPFAAFAVEDIPVGFAGANITENWLHIAEADVHPNWQRQGIGRRLINALLAEGKARGLTGVSLTTDRYAPFNAPFYASLGFEIVQEEALSPRLKALLAAETTSGLAPQRRVAMQLVY